MNIEIKTDIADVDLYVTEPIKAKEQLATNIISLMGPMVDETIRNKKENLKKNERQLKMICINIDEMKINLSKLAETYKELKNKKLLLNIIDKLIVSGKIYQSTLTVEVKRILMNLDTLSSKDVSIEYRKLSLILDIESQ
jgi:MoaA/NifB/PqqE/SkfB family radical SAM enzyme